MDERQMKALQNKASDSKHVQSSLSPTISQSPHQSRASPNSHHSRPWSKNQNIGSCFRSTNGPRNRFSKIEETIAPMDQTAAWRHPDAFSVSIMMWCPHILIHPLFGDVVSPLHLPNQSSGTSQTNWNLNNSKPRESNNLTAYWLVPDN